MARKKIPENYEKMKQSMIQAAIEVMLKKSMTEFSLSDVAEALGLTKAAIYWYFPNKNALIEEVAHCIYDTYIGFVNRVSESNLSSYEKLRLIILGELDTVQSAMMCVFPLKFFLESYSKDNAVKTLIKNGYEKYNGLVSSLIIEGVQSGSFNQICLHLSCQNLLQAQLMDLHFRIYWFHQKTSKSQERLFFQSSTVF